MLDSLEPFVSRHLLDLIAAGQPSVTLDATLVFGDVAGFTALNERLSKLGREGAERMVDLLDAVFGQALETANGFGGDLLKFGGDALLIMFDGPGHAERAAAAALAMQKGDVEADRGPPGDRPHPRSACRWASRRVGSRCCGAATWPPSRSSTDRRSRRPFAARPTRSAGEILLGPRAAAELAGYAAPGERGTGAAPRRPTVRRRRTAAGVRRPRGACRPGP